MRRNRRGRKPALRIAEPGRLVGAALAGLVLSGLLLLQALSSVSTVDAPQLAERFFVPNGLAAEQRASRLLMQSVKTQGDVIPSAQAAASIALAAFRAEPLTPKAHAILALAETDPQARARILEAATKINRRDLLLQGMVLEEQVKSGDYPGSLATLDRLLKVHPEQQAALFPVLMQALGERAALPAFGKILDGRAEWHNDFLDFAVRRPEALHNLARLREARKIGTPEFERRLIAGLADTGRTDQAYALFRLSSGKQAARGDAGPIDWEADFAPFDWKFADEGGFRAQQGRRDDEMEIYVRGGKGGLIAERLIRAPNGRFGLQVAHRILPADQIRDVRLQLRCAGSQTPFFDERFKSGENLFEVGSVPSGCGFLGIGIHARAWSGRSALRGTVDQIEIIRLADLPEPDAPTDSAAATDGTSDGE